MKRQCFAGCVFCNHEDVQIIAILRRICVNALGDNADAVPVIHFCSVNTERGVSAGNIDGQECRTGDLFVVIILEGYFQRYISDFSYAVNAQVFRFEYRRQINVHNCGFSRIDSVIGPSGIAGAQAVDIDVRCGNTDNRIRIIHYLKKQDALTVLIFHYSLRRNGQPIFLIDANMISSL